MFDSETQIIKIPISLSVMEMTEELNERVEGTGVIAREEVGGAVF